MSEELLQEALKELKIQDPAQRKAARDRLEDLIEMGPAMIRAERSQPRAAVVRRDLDDIAKAACRLRNTLKHVTPRALTACLLKTWWSGASTNPDDRYRDLVSLLKSLETAANEAASKQPRYRRSDDLSRAKQEVVRVCLTTYRRYGPGEPKATDDKFLYFLGLVWQMVGGKQDADLTRQIKNAFAGDAKQ
jgi:hypothetical protein